MYRVRRGVRATGAALRSTNRTPASSRASRSPEATTTASVSRRCPGPSPTTTRGRTEAPQSVRGRDDEPRIGVDRRVAEELDEVRLEEHGAVADVRLDEPEPVDEESLEIAVVGLGTQNCRGRSAGHGEGLTLERRWSVERPRLLGHQRAAGCDPRRRGAGSDEELAARRLTRAT